MNTTKISFAAIVMSYLLPASDSFIKVYREIPAQRTVLVRGGGHFPVAIRLKNGDIAVLLRGGGGHGLSENGRIDMLISKDQGKTWSEPRAIVEGPDDDRNPAFGQLSEGTLVLAYSIAKIYDRSGNKLTWDTKIFEGIYVTTSSDVGKTWTKPAKIKLPHPPEEMDHFAPFGKIIQTPDGAALMQFYIRFKGQTPQIGSYLVRSRDGGKTWGDLTLIRRGFSEAGLVSLPNGTLMAGLRSEGGNYIALTYSHDQGYTWEDPKRLTDDMEHPADIIRLRNGSVLLTYGKRSPPYEVHAMLSPDGGKSWDADQKIALAWNIGSLDSGFPSSVELDDGRILTVYYQVNDRQNEMGTVQATALTWSLPDKHIRH